MAAIMTVFGSVAGLIAGITAFFGFDATLWHSILIYFATAFGLLTVGIALYVSHDRLSAEPTQMNARERVKSVQA